MVQNGVGKLHKCQTTGQKCFRNAKPDLQSNYIELANTKPSLLLQGDKPRLIDEWQVAPVLWNAMRYSVDSSGLFGEYILTGSTTPKDFSKSS